MANFRHSQKWTQTRNLNFAYTTPRTNGDYSAYIDHVADNLYPSNSVILKPINSKFGDMIKFNEPHLSWKFENESFNGNMSYQLRKFLPFIPMGILASIF